MAQSPLHKLSLKDELDDSNLLRTLIDSLPDQAYVKDTESRYVLNNVAHVRALGASSPEEVAGKSDSHFYPEELAKRYHADEREIFLSGRPLIAREEPGVDEEGNERWHSITKAPLRDSSGEIVGLVGVIREVTERKKAEEELKESEERFRSMTEAAFEGIAINENGKILDANRAYADMFGYEVSELCGMPVLELHPPETRNEVWQRISSGYSEPYESKGLKKDGTTFDVEIRGRTVLYADHFVRMTAIRDVTERRRAEEALRESEERFRTAFEDAPIGVALVDLDGQRFRVNRALCEMLGCSEEELLRKAYLEHVHPEDHEISSEHFRKTLEKGEGSYTLERRYVHADGHIVWNLTSVSLIKDVQGNPSHFVCLHQDITERKELEKHLEHQAFHDSLTGLPNRALFLDRLGHALARARREDGSTTVLLLDLDDFKVVNDSLGHDAGNAVLIEVAERLRDSVRPGDTVARIFGDEFAVLLEAPTGAEEARLVTQRVQERLQEPFEVGGQEVYVRSSIGITLAETAEHQPEEALRHADLAMYEAKRKGKAQYEVYAPGMSHRAVARMDLESDLRRAVEREEFEVHYQPEALLETGAIAGMEALVRWRHPDRGLLPPAQFIPLAEKTGLIDRIGLWVLRESCRQVKEWQERYPTKLDLQLGLCVNLSAREIQQPDLAEKVAGVLHETGLDPSRLVLEISERTAIEDAEQTIIKLRELKDLDVKLAIDDFGTGYCSLVYLEHSLLDVLKIDRVLIHREREDPEECATIISAMTSMAHSLGLTVVVEGVEEEWQLTKLKEKGCEMAQGYYFAKPLPAEAVERLLVEDNSSW